MLSVVPSSWYTITKALFTLILTAWITGAAHWLLMFIYNNIGCHSMSFIGLLLSPLQQARPECIFIWRVANHAHWFLFDIFGKIIGTIIP